MPTYTNLEDVKKILTLGHDKSFMFSDCLAEVELLNDGRPNVDMIFNPDEVLIKPTFSKFLDLKLQFIDSTNFNVYVMDKRIKQKRLISSGDINTTWVSPSTEIEIPPSTWGGTIVQDDIVDLGFRSYISDNYANQMIEDTEVMIDSMITESGTMFVQPGFSQLFPNNIPSAVQVATKYLSAYYIYTDTFQDKFRDEVSYQDSFVRRWKRRAEMYLKGFIDAQGFTSPRVLAFPQYMPNQFGDADVGPGYGGMSTNKADVVRDSGTSDIFEV